MAWINLNSILQKNVAQLRIAAGNLGFINIYSKEDVDGLIGGKASYATFNTYALMLTTPTPTVATVCRVLIDENKGINNTIYLWYSEGKRIWIAATEDN